MIQALREVNFAIGVITFVLLCYRTPEALLNVTSKRLYLVLIVFPLLATFASLQAFIQHAPPGPITPLFTLAYLALGYVCIWWPDRLAR